MFYHLLKRTSNKSLSSMCDKYIAIQKKTTVNQSGDITETWNTIVGFENVPCGIMPLTASQKAEFRSHNVIATHYFILRGEIRIIEDTYRFLYDSREFEILTSENIREKDEINLCITKERRA